MRGYVARNLAEAHLIAGYLHAEGIPCEVRGEHLTGVYGEVPITYDTLPAIWLAPQDRARARQRIEAALHGIGSGLGWMCPSCGETLEAQFTECWKCGASKTHTETD